MNKRCRDCGYELCADARGCPGCAMNVEAERMIDHFIRWRLMPFVIVVVLAGAALFLLLR